MSSRMRRSMPNNDTLDGGHQVVIEVRNDGLSSSMKSGSRRRSGILTRFAEAPSYFKSFINNDTCETPEPNDTKDECRPSVHYTIRNRPNDDNKTFCQRYFCCGSTDGAVIDENGSSICGPTKFLSTYLLWAFRTGFLSLFAAKFCFFILLVLIFSALIYLVGFFYPHCFQPNFAEGRIGMNSAFTLSWTTFSTVGYGNIYPSLSVELSEAEDISVCAAISFLCTLESFVGVLYAGLCGAILFSKVLRIQSSARVLFSDPIVIRYGTGVQKKDNEDIKKCAKLDNEVFPCPVLEFRLVNTLSNTQGGEILDAHLSAVAIIDIGDLHTRKPSSKDRKCSLPNLKSMKNIAVLDRKSTLDDDSDDAGKTVKKSPFLNLKSMKNIAVLDRKSTLDDDSYDAGKTVKKSPLLNSKSIKNISVNDRKEFTSLITRHEHFEDAASDLGSSRCFSKLTIEPPDHPFFRRVWVARHVLNESSPLLTAEAKKMIKENNGFWPKCSFTRVRDSIKFSQIAVSLSGVSNVSASSVYANKLYDFVDINVGYQFASVLYKDERDVIRVDTALINDVLEQDGGGGEPY